MSPIREIAGFTAPKPESPIRRYRAEAALNGPITDRRASFTRRFRAVRVRHASTRPNLSRIFVELGPSDDRADPDPQSAFLSEEQCSSNLWRFEYQDRRLNL